MRPNEITKFLSDNRSNPNKPITLTCKELLDVLKEASYAQYLVDKEIFTSMLRNLGHDVIDGEETKVA